MSFKCKIGFHSWDGCKCSECGKIRDEQHNYDSDCENCSICGKVKKDHHDWSEDCEKCRWCDQTRENQHDWSRDCQKCSKCGKIRKEQHSWNGCMCSKCGKVRDEQHKWVGCTCSVCGETRKHKWSNGVCTNCNKKMIFSDNSGTLIKDPDQAFAAWQPYQFNNYTGSLVFKFSSLKVAKNALSQLSFIQIASDNSELISTEVIEYGYFENGSKSDVVIWGPSFNIKMWEEANEKLGKAGGVSFSSQKPKNGKPEVKGSDKGTNVEKVIHVRDEQMNNANYKIYSAPSKSAAMDFLQENPVTESMFYIIVETPEGNYARDKMGIYREDQG